MGGENRAMWKIYASDYVKYNRTASYAARASSFIAALFLSFLGSLFYNFWLDGAREGKAVPPVLAAFYLIVLALAGISLILVIHNSYAVSMLSRMHQFGIFSSIGATPGQIMACLLQEAFMLSLYAVPAGVLVGILASYGTVRGMSAFAENLAGGRRMDFALHPAAVIAVLLLAFLTVLISAWIPARKLRRLTPLEAIRGGDELQSVKARGLHAVNKYIMSADKRRGMQRNPVSAERTGLLQTVFGIEGELAGNALRAQKKALRTTRLSLFFAFCGFMLMQCFFTLSDISTGHTYFEAYQDAWDVMTVVKDAEIEDFALTAKLQELQDANSVVVYQKAEAVCFVPAERISTELAAKGGPEAIAGITLSAGNSGYLIETPLVILDDESFAAYCGQLGIEESAEGAVVYNRIWNSADSNFRYPSYLPYIKEDTAQIMLCGAAGAEMETPDSVCGVEIPVLACSETPPLLREEYGDYALVQFMPVSYWKKLSGRTGGAKQDLCIRAIAKDRSSPAALEALEKEITQIVGREYRAESENRIQEKQDNDKMIWGYKMILGGLCVLFAAIGIANMFAGTLGFLHQRRREFARLLSVGLTPEGIRKIFCIEAAWLVGRPLLAALSATAAAAAWMIKLSYLDSAEFLRKAPAGQISVFVTAVFVFTALAYYLGGRKILRMDLAAALRDDIFL